MSDASEHVENWLVVPSSQRVQIYALGYRFRDDFDDPWTERFNSVKYAGPLDICAVPDVISKMTRVLNEAIVSLMNDLRISPLNTAFIAAIPSQETEAKDTDVVAYLTKESAENTGAVYLPHALSKKPFESMHKLGLNQEQRLQVQEMADYRCRAIEQRTVFIFDDVTTSGSTLEAIANAVQSSNPRVEVIGVALAKAANIEYSDFFFEIAGGRACIKKWVSTTDTYGSVKRRVEIVKCREFKASGDEQDLLDEFQLIQSKAKVSNNHIPQLWDDLWRGKAREPSKVFDLKVSHFKWNNVCICWKPPDEIVRGSSILYEVHGWYRTRRNQQPKIDLRTKCNEESVFDSLEYCGDRTYRVRAVNEIGPGSWSYVSIDGKDHATELTHQLNVASQLQVEGWDANTGYICLAWNTGLPSTVEYCLERSSDGTTSRLDSNTTSASFELPLVFGGIHRFRLMAGLMDVWNYCSGSVEVVVAVGDCPTLGLPPLDVQNGGMMDLCTSNGVRKVKDLWDLVEALKEMAAQLTCQIVGVDAGGLIVTWGSIHGYVPYPLSMTGPGQSSRDRIGLTGIFVIQDVPSIDTRRRRSLMLSELELSFGELEEDSWETVMRRYRAGVVVVGIVRELKNYGVLVELERNIVGMIHVSEFRKVVGIEQVWDVVSKGDGIRVEILSIDQVGRNIALGFRGKDL